jgi:aminocarboxymuconate-semialdehyde decarboxylase
VRKDAALLPSEYLRRFYYDCISHSDDGFDRVLGMVGSDRILLGTDFPADMGLPNAVDWLGTRTSLSEADREAICSTNALRLLNLGPQAGIN